MGRVIVGVDGSDNAAHALRWAVARAEQVPGEVVALMSWNASEQGHMEDGETLQEDFDEADAVKLLAEAVEHAGVTGAVVERTVEGVPSEVLAEAVEPEDLIVVGARGLGGFKGLLLGSVSSRVLPLAPCPVVVIHDGATLAIDGEVVVGVDGSQDALRAVQWAGSEARALQVPLRIVRAWQAPQYRHLSGPEMTEVWEEEARTQLAEAANDPSLSGLTVKTEAPQVLPADALLAHGDAAMLVVGRSGSGAVARLLLGSVSRQVTEQATVPVVVI